MPVFYKILGQVSPAASTETNLYTATIGTIGSSMIVCNRASTQTSFRVSVAQGGAATSNKDYIYYDLLIGGNDTFIATVGITLSAGDEVRVYTSSTSLSFSLYGSEIS